MLISRFAIEGFVNEIEEYQKNRTSKTKAFSIEDCNQYFHHTDGYLRVLLQSMRQQLEKKRIPNFGLKIAVDTSPSSKLGKKCCLCPEAPVPYATVNTMRSAAENFIFSWLPHAKKYLVDNTYVREVKKLEGLSVTSKRAF